MLPKKIAFVDIETTGARHTYDRIIEIGIVLVENNQVLKTFSTLINPQKYLSPDIILLTGITNDQLEEAPTFRQVKEEIFNLLKDCLFVAHNVRFDYSFIKNEFKRFDIDFSPKHLCTVKLSRKLFPKFKHHNLDSLINRFSLSCQNRHRALDDAKVLWDFYQICQQKFPPEKLVEAINLGLKKPSLPVGLTHKQLDNLEEEPGVYIFYGQSNLPLYIGKSINIKERIKSHFSSDHSSSLEMKIAQQVKQIETIPTPGELGALVLESALIKKMQPLYNKKLRRSHKLITLTETKIPSNKPNQFYSSIQIETLESLTLYDLDRIYGIFRSIKQAKQYLTKIAKEYGLCEKLLNLENTNQSCFGYRLGRCKGACVFKQEPKFYNLKFALAFSHKHFQKWPFQTPVVIEEKNQITQKGELHLVDKWCYLGSFKYDQDLEDQKFISDLNFDLDTYKILHTYLKNPKNQHKIKSVDKYKQLSHSIYQSQSSQIALASHKNLTPLT